MKNVKTFIQERLGKRQSSSGVSAADEIMKLKKLKDDGVISESEFNELKKKLVS
jgi:hypothetical protein